ncbi:HTH-type transcriptional regulator ImmR [compost metagenome]
MSTLGNRLKRAREKKGMTQQEVADKLGVSNGAISGYERNYRDPDTEMLKKLATLYEVSVDYLTGNVVNESTATYEVNRETKLREEIKRLSEMIVELPEQKRKLVEEMIRTLSDKK